MTVRPIPADRAEAQQMRRTGSWRGKKLCGICGENVADTTVNGDAACQVCVRQLSH